MTPTEALARIAAHCTELETDAHPGRLVAQVRAVLAEVTPEAGAAIDRDDLRALLDERFRNEHEADDDDVDSIIRLIEPVAGVVLSPEEAAEVARWLRYLHGKGFPVTDQERALAARLEAAQ